MLQKFYLWISMFKYNQILIQIEKEFNIQLKNKNKMLNNNFNVLIITKEQTYLFSQILWNGF